MPRHHYSNRAILILENPWELDSADCNRTSVLPFVEGIAKLAGDTEVFHANFYDKRSFDRALEILCSARFNNAVIYIAAHGSKSKVGGVKLEDILFAIGDHSKNTNITGIMLDPALPGRIPTPLRSLCRAQTSSGAPATRQAVNGCRPR